MMLQRFGITGMTANNNSKAEPSGRKTGVFGGTFNPVHKGHVFIANEFLSRLSLDLLLIIPNRIPPLKADKSVSGEDRMNMLKIAFSGTERVEISDIELKREGMSYTCDTVAELKRLYPDDELFFLIGDDWAEGFVRWRNYREILSNARLVVAKRSGEDIKEALDRLERECGKRPIELNNEMLPLSSGGFREDPKKEKLPDGVFEYIQEKGLYGI